MSETTRTKRSTPGSSRSSTDFRSISSEIQDIFTRQHLERVLAGISPQEVANLAAWIEQNTFLRGLPFSFKDHEYQRTIAVDKARIKYIRKCSQVGVSELAVRLAIAFCMVNRGVNLLYVLPTALFASTFSATRLAVALDNCPVADDALHPGTDSTTVKRFLHDSFIFMRGASRASQAISVPCDHLVVDEVDFAEDQDVLTSFTSRLTHSPFKLETWFSTPTFAKHGISYGFENSIRHHELQKCHRCNHWFQPDYFEHVKLPGFNAPLGTRTVDNETDIGGRAGLYNRQLDEINFFSKELLAKYDVNKAYLACPKCHRPVNQHIRYRKFVAENPDDKFDAHGFQITPFCAPKTVPPGEIIRISTRYKSQKDFINNCLGLPAEDSTTGLDAEEVRRAFYTDINFPDRPALQVCGADMGGACAVLTGYPAPDGHLRVMTAELVPLHKMKVRFPEILGTTRSIASCIDALPYSDMVAELQDRIPTLWASIYTQTKGLELYQVKEKEEDEDKALYGVRQLNVKKNAGLDLVVTMLRAGKLSFAPGTFEMQEKIVTHLTDMKRVKIKRKDGEEEYVWKKSARGEDHFFHALLYLVLANFVKGLSAGVEGPGFLATTFSLPNSV